MCGIAAIFNYRTGAPINRAELTQIRDAMARRGPDGAGDWFSSDGCVGLGHRRLSIIDLSENGAQPMKSPDGSVVVTFNGEIYNYRELRSGLEAQGCQFQSASDTEVLLHLYERQGAEMVHQLRGMYAFAIWDSRKQGLFLARDPFGIKPLYYSDDGKTLRVASQVKALLAGGGVDTSPEPAGHVGFFLWGHVPGPYTLYRGIRGLSAGSTLWVDRQGNHLERTFCSITQILVEAERTASSTPLTAGEQRERLHAALADSVQHHLIADVPVGVFLSSGLDSTTITALASESCRDLRTVTLAFEEYRRTPQDESPLAAEVAALYGARHQTVWVSKQDFRENFSRVMQAMDQPSSDGINTFFVSLAAVRAGLRVALSGLGGDELFGGYPGFSEIPRLVGLLGRFSAPTLQRFNAGLRVVSAPLLKRLTSPKYASLLEYGGTWGGAYLLRRGMFMPWELPEVLGADLARQGWDDLQPLVGLNETVRDIRSPFLKVGALELSWYMRNQLLRDTDWASMDHSLEVRTPLIDAHLLRTLGPLLGGAKPPSKRDMARSPLSPLPASVLSRPKTGFSIPVRDWLLDCQLPAQPALSTPHSAVEERGLRGWAKLVYAQFAGAQTAPVRAHRRVAADVSRRFLQCGKSAPTDVGGYRLPPAPGKRILVLAGDAFGGHGGIAKFNRDLLTALCNSPDVSEVVALPRLMEAAPGPLPAKLTWNTSGLGGKLRYLKAVLNTRKLQSSILDHPSSSSFDLVICAHINLLPFAFLARRLAALRGSRPPLALVIHGIEAWTARERATVNRLAKRIDYFVAVSQVTKDRFLSWAGLPQDRGFILPNCVDASRFGAGPKNPVLVQRYGLHDKKVIMTFGRLASEERYKGFDEVLEILPKLAVRIPNLTYLIVGEGPDRARLEDKARNLKVQDRVVFTGRIPEADKAEHYRLADAYVMPSRGEGFGIVFLEAMACGIPVLGSKSDGSREALRNGELGILVDPDNREELQAGILSALSANGSGMRPPPPGLDYFSHTEFEKRCGAILNAVWKREERRG